MTVIAIERATGRGVVVRQPTESGVSRWRPQR